MTSTADTELILEFPCHFPIKAMGRNVPDLDGIIVEIVRRHVDDLHEGAVTTKESKGGKFISVTVNIEAQSKAQLDAIYTDINACPHVVMSL